jgi:hypothetical protein
LGAVIPDQGAIVSDRHTPAIENKKLASEYSEKKSLDMLILYSRSNDGI